MSFCSFFLVLYTHDLLLVTHVFQKVRKSAAECLEQLFVLSEKYHSALPGGNDHTLLFLSHEFNCVMPNVFNGT